MAKRPELNIPSSILRWMAAGELEHLSDAAERARASRFVGRQVALRMPPVLIQAALVGILCALTLVPIAWVAGLASRYTSVDTGNWPTIVAITLGMAFSVNWLALLYRRRARGALRRYLIYRGVPVCVGCGYNLTGVPVPRCPECGRPAKHPRLRRLIARGEERGAGELRATSRG